MFDEFEKKIFSFLKHGYPMKHRKLPESNEEIESYSTKRIQAKVKRNPDSERYALSSFRLKATLSLYLSFLLVNFLGLFLLIGEEPNSLGEYLMYRLPSTIMGLQFLVSQLMLRTMVLAYVPFMESSKTLSGWLLVSSRATIILGILFIFVTLFTVSYMTITQIWLTQYGYWFLIHLLVMAVVLVSPKSKTARESLIKTNNMLDKMSLRGLMENKNRDNMDMVQHDRIQHERIQTRSSPFIPEEKKTIDSIHSITPVVPVISNTGDTDSTLSSRENRDEKSPEGGKRSKPPLRPSIRGPGHKVSYNKANPVTGGGLKSVKTSSKF